MEHIENIAKSTMSELAAQINDAHRHATQAAQAAVEHAINAGNLLLQAKVHVEHGGWLTWVKENCEVSERTAQAYMRLAREYPKLETSKAQRVADLPLRQALKAIAEPTEGADGSETEKARQLEEAFDELEEELRRLREELAQATDVHSIHMVVQRSYELWYRAVYLHQKAKCEYLRVTKQLRDLGFELTGDPKKDEAIAREIVELCNQRMQELMAAAR